MENNIFANHEMEQAEAGMRDLARLMWTFYTNLGEQGFNNFQALSLTQKYLVSVIRGGMKRDED